MIIGASLIFKTTLQLTFIQAVSVVQGSCQLGIELTFFFLCCYGVQDLLVGRDSWSMSELVHAIAIMAHYHSLAGFCLGCGVNPEIDTPIGHADSSKKGDSSFVYGAFTNPALGIGRRTPSDSESETLSPTARSPTLDGSPTQRNMTKSLVQHYIESE